MLGGLCRIVFVGMDCIVCFWVAMWHVLNVVVWLMYQFGMISVSQFVLYGSVIHFVWCSFGLCNSVVCFGWCSPK